MVIFVVVDDDRTIDKKQVDKTRHDKEQIDRQKLLISGSDKNQISGSKCILFPSFHRLYDLTPMRPMRMDKPWRSPYP